MPLHADNALTPREKQIVAMIAEGASNGDIAASLGVTYETVKSRVSSIFDKVGCESRLQLAVWWWKEHQPSRLAELEEENATLRRQRDMWRSWSVF